MNWDDLIAKWLCQETSKEENELVNELIETNSEFRKQLEHSRIVFHHVAEQPSFDAQDGWKNLRKELNWKTETYRLFRFNLISKVAVFLALAGLGYSLFLFNKPDKHILTFESVGHKKELPDGSTVWLDKGSSVEWEGNFKEKRSIKLSGSCFFQIIHDSLNPMELELEGLLIRDLGTAFSVTTDSASGTIQVYLESGLLELQSKENNLVLNPGEQAIYQLNTGKIIRNRDAVKGRPPFASVNLKFVRTSLLDVVEQINDSYGIQIRLDSPQLSKCELNASFSNESPDVVIDIICETLGLEQVRLGDEIVITGSSCN